MDGLRPPPPRPPAGGSAAALRKQALMGSHRSGSGPVGTVLEEGAPDQTRPDAEQPSCSGRSVELRHWEDYFDACDRVEVPGRGSFAVYTAGSTGAVVLCLHGGGYTGLTWSLVAQRLKDRYRVVAPDLRGHGASRTEDDLDFSAETMTADVVAIWKALFAAPAPAAAAAAPAPAAAAAAAAPAAAAGGAEPPAAPPPRVPTLLVGHSMGGALAVRAAATKQIAGLEGLVVIDVVEGTAIAALPHMGAVLRSRPQRFASPQAAADWAVRSGTCKRPEAAGVSFPSQVVPADAGSSGGGGGGGSRGGGGGEWRWRTPLEASEPFWEGWYSGLSGLFLALPVPKMLLLAGTDRLDRELTIGQMQGKFQLVLMPAAGHAIQEDEPAKTAEHLAAFLHRFRVGEPPLALPRAPPGAPRVLPVAAGPLHEAGARGSGRGA
ncbi:phosphatase methylesterase [Raphidocelis subcapitata]|uniref:protein phosphatase methylesterase-1 n=1 Tax=Raphidocelis subcapitata TaxID=307507 RepID=A0A2V0P473_9CHLO|nr:phosphatase methylesterase [Raphidocelis subcapitata]|eukprot:GBF94379.1 phosphatase methylesterase [Raphidocelis subcapitata]